MKRANIVTAFLEYNGLVLILKRSKDVKTMKGKWAGISGYIEEEEALDAAIREIKEETGIDKKDLKLLSRSSPIEVYDDKNNTLWIVHPFLFHTENINITIDKEHEEYRWIKPKSIVEYDTVPKLFETLNSLLKL